MARKGRKEETVVVGGWEQNKWESGQGMREAVAISRRTANAWLGYALRKIRRIPKDRPVAGVGLNHFYESMRTYHESEIRCFHISPN